MSSGVKLQLAQAERLTRHLVEKLAPACARVEIAGSIRRRRPEVGDIELVAIPTEIEVQSGLFDTLSTERPLDALLEKLGLPEGGKKPLLKRVKGGDKYKQFEVWLRAGVGIEDAAGVDFYHHCQLDLFLATPETWGSIFTIRTGSANFTHRLVTDRQHGGLCPSHLRFHQGRIQSRTSGKVLDTPEEKDIFEACCLQWIKPENRT